MGIDIAELYIEELASLNRAVALFGIPDDVFRECGLSYLDISMGHDLERVVNSRLGKGDATPPEIISRDSDTSAEFERLCQAAPHIPRSSLSFLSLAYGAFLMATQNGQDMSGLKAAGGSEMLSLKVLMSIVQTRSVALGHSGLSDGVLKIVQIHMGRKKMLSEAASKRHAENHSMKQDVFQWLDLNMSNFKSMEAAAGAIAGKLQPVTFRTARDWVGQWKKLRSTGTP